MEGLVAEAQPTKRQKLSPSLDAGQDIGTDGIADQTGDFAQQDTVPGALGHEAFAGLHRLKEMEVGITSYIDGTALGFSGILKKRYTDFLVNEILPSGQVLHLESLQVPSQPAQPGYSQRRHTKTVQTNTEATATNQSSSSIAASSTNDELQKKRADAIAAWGKLPAQLAEDDARHRKKQLEEYAAYKAREGLLDPQCDTPKYSNGVSLVPNADIHLAEPPKLQSGVPREETLTPSTDKGAAIALGLLEEDPKCKDQDNLEPTDKVAAGPPIEAAETNEKNGFRLTAEDESLLLTFFSPIVLREILALYNKVLASKDTKGGLFGKIKSNIAMERSQRTQLHQSMRRIFSSRLETETDGDGAIVVSVSGSSGRSRWSTTPRQTKRNVGPLLSRKSVWEERGGEYLHFTLYKENKDTMEVTSFLAKQLRIQPKSLQFAGTKDRRAVTVQRISAYRLDARKLAGMNKILYGSKIGDFGYSNEGLSLGDLAGNEFVITLRDCKFRKTEGMNFQGKLAAARSIVNDSVLKLEQKGFLNYYGLQRFGTFSTGTHEVGVRMLQGNFKDACQKILSFNPEALVAAENPQSLPSGGSMISFDDIRRAVALDLFRTTGKSKEALERLPRKFSAEAAVIRHLSQEKASTDWQGALQTISRPLRLMYVHAYQSFIWNIVAGERWNRWGSNVVEGDLVLAHDHGDVGGITDEMEEDENGEVVIHAQPQNHRGKGEQEFERARPLSKEEAASGKYSIFDIVLPTPGFDVVYPANTLASFYEEFMSSERGGGLDPHDMRRSWKDISLSGSYRKLVGRVRGLEFSVRPYVRENEQMVMTDFERLDQKTRKGGSNTVTTAAATTNIAATISDVDCDPEEEGGVELTAEHDGEDQQKIAVVVKFQLGTSQYATMALRELMKDGGAVAYKPEYGGGR